MAMKGRHTTERGDRIADTRVVGEPRRSVEDLPGCRCSKPVLPAPPAVNVWGRPLLKTEHCYNRGAL